MKPPMELLAYPAGFQEFCLAIPAQIERIVRTVETPQQAKAYLDQAETIAAFARRIKADKDSINSIQYGKLKLIAKLAELMPREKGGRNLPSQWEGFNKNTKVAYRKVGDHADAIDSYYQKATETEEEISLAGFIREIRLQQRNEKQEELQQRPRGTCITESLDSLISDGEIFTTIYADPPWQYDNRGTRSAASYEYKKTMTVEDLISLPVAKVADERSHLHLWTTNAFLHDAFHVIEAWGFEFKSALIWTKPQIGIGNYWRVNHEYLLFASRGGLQFLDTEESRKAKLHSHVMHDRIGHSVKPEIFRKMIEKVSPPSYLEMFGRRIAEGWTVLGNEIERTMFDGDIA